MTGPDSFPGWLTDLVEKAVFELMNDHRAELTTSRFTASIELKPRLWGNWDLRYTCAGPNQAGGGQTRLLRSDLRRRLTDAIFMLVINQVQM